MRDSELAANAFFTALFVVLLAGSWALLARWGSMPRALGDITPWEFTLLALATFRLTRIVAKEEVGKWVRALFPLDARFAPARVAGQLVRCPWCLGVWMAWFVLTAYLLAPAIAGFFVLVLALAGGAVAVHTAVGALRAAIPPEDPKETDKAASPHTCR